MKKVKGLKNAHTSNNKIGSGDYYGVALKAKVGRMIDGVGINPPTTKSVKTPPKSLA